MISNLRGEMTGAPSSLLNVCTSVFWSNGAFVSVLLPFMCVCVHRFRQGRIIDMLAVNISLLLSSVIMCKHSQLHRFCTSKSVLKVSRSTTIITINCLKWCHLSQRRLGLKTTSLKMKKICRCGVRKKWAYQTSVARASSPLEASGSVLQQLLLA